MLADAQACLKRESELSPDSEEPDPNGILSQDREIRQGLTSTSMRRLVAWALVIAACSPASTEAEPPCPALPDPLPGLQQGPAPWDPAHATLESRLTAIGAPILTQEGQVVDRHFQVTIEVEGRRVTVPALIGINGIEVAGGVMETGFVTEMHTHDDSGTAHVHANSDRLFSLGEFFDVWGVAFHPGRIGGYCDGAERVMTVAVNGSAVAGDPRLIEIEDLTRIEIAVR